MKKLNTLIQYECTTSFKYIWLFYAIEYAIVLLIYVIVAVLTGDPKNAGTNCLEMNTFIYVGILGALGYSEDFKMMIQNGFTRKYIFTASFVMFAFIGGIMSLVDTVTGNLLHYFLPNYSSLFGVIYGYGDILPNWLWLFLVYLTVCCLFYLAILVINRLGKVSSLTLGIVLAMVIVLVLPVVFRFLLPGRVTEQIRRFLMGAMGFPRGGDVNLLFPILFFMAVFLLLGTASYLVIRRAELKA